MSDETTALTATLKAGQGFEAPWLVVRADTPADMLKYLDAVGQHGVLAKIAEVATEFGGIHTAARGLGATPVAVEVPQGVPVQVGPTTPQAFGPALQASAAPEAAAPGPTCQHGAMTFRSGTKNGRQWRGYFCATPKGTPDQCDPVFIKTN